MSRRRGYAERAVPTRGGTRSRLLHVLDDADAFVEAHATRVRLERGDVLFRQGEPISAVHFPETCVLSMLTRLKDGTTIEFATIGPEGCTGVPVFLGVRTLSNALCVAQIPGEALVVDAEAFLAALRRSSKLRDAVGLYTHSLIVQLAQTVACGSAHSVVERVTRWLLTTADRIGRDTFPVTQEFLSYLLGVRRASISEAAAQLQAESLIAYRRGSVRILDRLALEAASCECYRVVKDAMPKEWRSPSVEPPPR